MRPRRSTRKLERNLARGLRTPVVILGIYSEDIRRVVGAYRPS